MFAYMSPFWLFKKSIQQIILKQRHCKQNTCQLSNCSIILFENNHFAIANGLSFERTNKFESLQSMLRKPFQSHQKLALTCNSIFCSIFVYYLVLFALLHSIRIYWNPKRMRKKPIYWLHKLDAYRAKLNPTGAVPRISISLTRVIPTYICD